MLRLQVLLCNELLDLIDLKRTVDLAARACVLAVLSADASADRRERVILLDELQSVGILAIRCHFDIALDGDVGRTCHLAGCRTGRPGLDGPVLIAVILVPLLFAPWRIVRELMTRILDGAVLRAQFLAKTNGAGRTCFNTLAAGYALFGIAFRGVCRCRKIRRVEELGCAQGIANADGTVADTEDLVFAVDICDLVDISAVFRLLKNLHGLFVGNIMAMAGFTAVI